jgi:hypothetical protein
LRLAPSAPPLKAQSAFPARAGEFTIKYLSAGRYRFALQLPSTDWYVRAITLPEARRRRPVDLARAGLALASGEKVRGVLITVATGAAGLQGKLHAAEGAKLPENLRVHLVPAEKDAAGDALRHAEVKPSGDGAFTFSHLAPGKYWLVARTADEPSEQPARPAAWEGAERARLRREAEAGQVLVELQPCQRVKDYRLKY